MTVIVQPGSGKVIVARGGAAGPPGAPGANGPTASNLTIGTFVGLAGQDLGPTAPRRVFTDSYRGTGVGGAAYDLWAVPMAALPSGMESQWWQTDSRGRKYFLSPDQPLNFFMFGAYGDYNPVTPGTLGTNYHDDYPAWSAMKAHLIQFQVQTSGNTNFKQARGPVTFMGAAYYMSAAHDISELSVDLRGIGRSASQAGATFYMAADNDGIRFQWINTVGKTGTTSTTHSAGGSHIEYLHWWSIGNATSDIGSGTAYQQDGLTMRCPITAKGCSWENFSNNGGVIYATSGGGMQGNANGWLLEDCGFHFNYNIGLDISGGDVNAGSYFRCSFYHNGYAGLRDNSFLANNPEGLEEGDNGGIGAGPFWGPRTMGTFCRSDASDGFGLYIWQVRRGMATAASTTAPARTAGNPWMPLVAGYVNTLYPLWVSGMTFIDGASYIFENISSCAAIINGYQEGTSPSPSITNPSFAIGGVLASAVFNGISLRGIGGYLGSYTGFRQTTHSRQRLDGTVMTNIFGSNDPQNNLVVFEYRDGRYTDQVNPSQPAVGLGGQWNDTTKNFEVLDKNSGAVMYELTGRYTTYQCGTGAATPDYIILKRAKVGNAAQARTINTANAASTAVAQGDLDWNYGATAGSPAFWIGVAAGSAKLPVGIVGAVQVAHQAHSTATDIAGLVADFNALLDKLQTSKLQA